MLLRPNYNQNKRVIDGWETLDSLENAQVDDKDRPTREIRIKNVTIHANPIAEEIF